MAGCSCVEWAPRPPRLVSVHPVTTPLFLVAASAGLCLLWFAVALSWQAFSALQWAPSSHVALSEESRGSSELEAGTLYTPADLAGLRPHRETQEKWRVVSERLPPRYPSLETRASRSSASSRSSSARGVPSFDRAPRSHVGRENFGEILSGSLSRAARDPEDRGVSLVRLTEKERFFSLADFPDTAYLALQGVASADATFNSPLEDLYSPSSASLEPAVFSSGSASLPVAPLSVASPASLGTPMSLQELSEEPVPGVDFPATRVFLLFVPQEYDSGGAAEEQIVQAFGFVESWRFVFGIGEKPAREPRLETSRLASSTGVGESGDVADAGNLARIWRPPLLRWRARKHASAPQVYVHPGGESWRTDAADSDTRNTREHVEEGNHEKSGEEKTREDERETSTTEKKAEHKREKANGEAKSEEMRTVTTARKESSGQSGSRESRDSVGRSVEGKKGDLGSSAGRFASSQKRAETSKGGGKATWRGGHADGEEGGRRLQGTRHSRRLHTHDHRVVETPVVNDILFVTEMKMEGANIPWICDELSSFSSLDAFREDLIKRIRLGLAQRRRGNGSSRVQKPGRGVDSRSSSEAKDSGDSRDEDFDVSEFQKNSLNQDSSSSSSSFSSFEGKPGESVNRCIVVRVTIDATQRSELWQLHPAMHSVSAATHPLITWLLQQYDLAMRSDNDTFLTPALLRRENTPWLSRVAPPVQRLRKEATLANSRRRRQKRQLKGEQSAQREETEKAGKNRKEERQEKEEEKGTAHLEEKEGKGVRHSVREDAHRRKEVMAETKKSVESEEGRMGSMRSVSGSREEGAVEFRDAVRLGQNGDDGDTASLEETETGEVKFAFFTGQGGYFNHKSRKLLPEYASLLGLRFQNLGLVGSTWYGRPADIVAAARYTVKIGEFLMKVDPVFQRGAGEWPAWYRGVLLLYSAELAVNHLFDREDVFIRSDLLDTESSARVDWRTSPALHVHCWHTHQFFSKFAFLSGDYPLYWFWSPEFDLFDIRWYSYTNALNGRERRRLQIESLNAVRESLLREASAGESGGGRAAAFSPRVSEDAMSSAAPLPPLSSKLTAFLSLPWSSSSLFPLPRVARPPHALPGESAALAASFRAAPLSFELARLAFPFQVCPFESPFPVHEGGSTRCCPRACAKGKTSKDDACCDRPSSGYRCPAPPCLHPSEFLWLLDSIAALAEDEVLPPVSEAEQAKSGETQGVDATNRDHLRPQKTHAGLLRGSDASPAACPAFFPFPFEGGRQCCATNKDCDGNPLGLESPCCWRGDAWQCWPTGATGCVAHPGIQMLSLEHGLTNSVDSASVLSPARRSAPGDQALMARAHAATVPELAKFLGGLGPADRGGALYAVEEQGTSLEALRQFRFTLQKEAFI